MIIHDKNLPALKDLLNSKLTNSYGVVALEIVERKSVMHYSEKTCKFVKVSTVLPKFVTQLRHHIEKGVSFLGATFWTTTYESNMPHTLRFMIDNEMVGMSWLDIAKGTYGIRARS